MCDPVKAQVTQPPLIDQAKMEPRRTAAFFQMPVLPVASMAVPSFPMPSARWDNMELQSRAARHNGKERRYSVSRPSPQAQRSGKARRLSCAESGAVHSKMPLPETIRFKIPSPAKSSKATAPLTDTLPIGTASGKRNHDVASKAACDVGSFNHENVLPAPLIHTEPAVEKFDHAPKERFCDSKPIHSGIPQNIDVAPSTIPSGHPTAVLGGLPPSIADGGNWDVINSLQQRGQTNIAQLRPPPPVVKAHGNRRLSEGAGSLVPPDIASAAAPAPRPSGVLRHHVSFANLGTLPGDTKSSASSSSELSRTSSNRGIFSEATSSSRAKRMAITGVCLACVAVLSFWVFYAITEVVIVSHEFASENGDPGTVRPQDEGAVDLPPRLLYNPSGFRQHMEIAGPKGGILVLPAELVPENDTSTEDFTDAVENS